jgi:hypothetical protein
VVAASSPGPERFEAQAKRAARKVEAVPQPQRATSVPPMRLALKLPPGLTILRPQGPPPTSSRCPAGIGAGAEHAANEHA